MSTVPQEISNGVFLIDTLAAGITGVVASYLVRGERSALVDVGHATSANTVLSELRALDSKSWQVDYLIPTHVHLDHAGAVGHLAKAMPNARVLVNKHGAKHLLDPTKLVESTLSLFGTEALPVFGQPLGVPREQVEAVGDLYDLDLGAGRTLKLFWTPGHAPHHMSVLVQDQQLLITGDAVGLHYPGFDVAIPTTPPPSFDEDQYVDTVSRIVGMNLSGLLLPHFGPVVENVQEFLRTDLETIGCWGSKVLEAVKAGEPLNRTFESLVADVAKRTGKPREEIPDYITQNIMLSVKGYYSYVQKRIGGQ